MRSRAPTLMDTSAGNAVDRPPVPRRAPLSLLVAGWVNLALGFIGGGGTAVGLAAGGLAGAEFPFFILLACLLVAVGAFVLAARPVIVTILGLSLLLFGLFLGFGILVGGSVFGAPDVGLAKAVGIAGFFLAALEAWSILGVWRNRERRTEAAGSPEPRDEGEKPSSL